ncbi:MAG: hypothetical protein ACD_22C00101G0003 [uncultured bacterium]|nr:MAG: hypothetical protein ACD_22C00101G0003 [uncultured bacterium]
MTVPIRRKIFQIIEPYIKSREAIVITGFRRVGKTTLLEHLFDSVGSENKLLLDLQNPVNQRIFIHDNYENIKINLEGLGLDFTQKAYLFLDEIQLVENISSSLKYLYDHYDLKLFLTGSSSFYLRNKFADSMSGRKYIFELYPLDFDEFILFKGLNYDTKVLHSGALDYSRISTLFREYMMYGGFPGVVLETSKAGKIKKLDDILSSYFQQDVQSLSTFSDNQKLKDLMFLLSSRVGSKLDIGKIAQSLDTTRSTTNNYLDFFSQTYFIGVVKPFSTSKDVEIKEKPKIYFIDTGLLNRVGKVTESKLFENVVYSRLKVRSSLEQDLGVFGQINYYATKTGKEIDFIFSKEHSYEVKTSGDTSDLRLLRNRSLSIGIKKYSVVSLDFVKSKSDEIIYPWEL